VDLSVRLAILSLFLALSCASAGPLAEKAVAAEAKHEAFVEGSDGYRFLPAELRFTEKLTSPDISAMAAPAVGVISDFAAQIKDAGIALLVVPVPPKVLVQGASLGIGADEQQAMRAGWETIMAELSTGGVHVIDLLGDFASSKEPMFCLRDSHWSGHGIDSAVKQLLPGMQSAGLNLGTKSAAAPFRETEINGDLGGEPEKVSLRFAEASASTASPPSLLLLGDSHVLVFHQGGDLHATGAGLPEQVAAILGAMPEVMGVRGSGATSSRLQLARQVRSSADYLRNIKMIVWVFAGREFTEADMWKKIPVYPRNQKR
jgi:hypothetical protein